MRLSDGLGLLCVLIYGNQQVLVEPEHGRSVLNVFKMELTGSRIAEIANGTFEGTPPCTLQSKIREEMGDGPLLVSHPCLIPIS
jgi:hypothetical protein